MKANKKKYYLMAVIFGAVSLSMYVALFTHQGWVTDTFTKGGYYAAYPILAAFIFSFIHGAFASNLLSSLGLEPKKK